MFIHTFCLYMGGVERVNCACIRFTEKHHLNVPATGSTIKDNKSDVENLDSDIDSSSVEKSLYILNQR